MINYDQFSLLDEDVNDENTPALTDEDDPETLGSVVEESYEENEGSDDEEEPQKKILSIL